MAEGAGHRWRGLPVRAARRRGGRRRTPLTLPITPLIDVIFLLLLYFMLAGRFQAAEGAISTRIEPEEARAQAAAFALPEIPAVVRVLRDASSPVDAPARIEAPAPFAVQGGDAAALGAKAKELLASGGLGLEQRVIVRAEESARWQDAIDVIAALSRAGLTRVVIDAEGAP